jgi:hypothetical protein
MREEWDGTAGCGEVDWGREEERDLTRDWAAEGLRGLKHKITVKQIVNHYTKIHTLYSPANDERNLCAQAAPEVHLAILLGPIQPLADEMRGCVKQK